MASLILGEDGSNGASATAALSRPKLTRQLTGTSDDADEVMGGMNSQVDTDESSSTNNVKNSSNQSDDGSGGGGGYQSTSTANIKLTFNMGGVKDEGVKGKENQDDYFVWSQGDGKTYVIAVLDGHGRELGKLASKSAKDSIWNDLCVQSEERIGQLRSHPQETMQEVFRRANDAIRTVCFFGFFFDSYFCFLFCFFCFVSHLRVNILGNNNNKSLQTTTHTKKNISKISHIQTTIQQSFVSHYTSRGIECKVEPGGFIVSCFS